MHRLLICGGLGVALTLGAFAATPVLAGHKGGHHHATTLGITITTVGITITTGIVGGTMVTVIAAGGK